MYLAIDIGGTKTLLAIFNSSGDIIQKVKFPTAPDPTAFTANLTTSFRKLFNSSDDIKSDESGQIQPPTSSHHNINAIKAIAVAVPGLVDGSITTSLPNLPQWQNVNLANVVHTALAHVTTSPDPTIPIAVNNDAAIATAFEAKGIPGKTIYLTISTGIGGGIATDGSTDIASHQFEPGHAVYDWHGHPTEWEKFASARALERDYNNTNTTPTQNSATPAQNSTTTTTTEAPSTPVIATDLTSPEQLADIAHRLSIGLADLITQYHPDTIILGGPLGQNLPLYHDALVDDIRSILSQHNSPRPTSSGTVSPLPNIIKAKLPQESTIYGCYLFARHLANAK